MTAMRRSSQAIRDRSNAIVLSMDADPRAARKEALRERARALREGDRAAATRFLKCAYTCALAAGDDWARLRDARAVVRESGDLSSHESHGAAALHLGLVGEALTAFERALVSAEVTAHLSEPRIRTQVAACRSMLERKARPIGSCVRLLVEQEDGGLEIVRETIGAQRDDLSYRVDKGTQKDCPWRSGWTGVADQLLRGRRSFVEIRGSSDSRSAFRRTVSAAQKRLGAILWDPSRDLLLTHKGQLFIRPTLEQVQVHPSTPAEPYLDLAWALMEMNAFDDAAIAVDRAGVLSPDAPDLVRLRALLAQHRM